MKAKKYAQTYAGMILNSNPSTIVKTVDTIHKRLLSEVWKDTVKRAEEKPELPYVKLFNEEVENKNNKWNKIVDKLESTYSLPKGTLEKDSFRTNLRKVSPDIFEAADMLEAVEGVIRQTNETASKDDFPYKAKPDTIPTPLQRPQ